MLRKTTTFLLATALTLLLTGCAGRSAVPTLYDDLGGSDGVTALVDAFIDRLAVDPVVIDTFANTDMLEFRRLAIQHMCEISDGGCHYEGRNMRDAHAGLGIDPRQFNAMVNNLMRAMDDVAVPQGAQNRLLGRLAPLYHDVLDVKEAGDDA
ncbi:MAG: group 1 truncated hemoglobin [Pseudomonadota bacterium]